MSQSVETELLMVNSLVEQYLETRSQTVLDILELLIEQNTYGINIAIVEILTQY